MLNECPICNLSRFRQTKGKVICSYCGYTIWKYEKEKYPIRQKTNKFSPKADSEISTKSPDELTPNVSSESESLTSHNSEKGLHFQNGYMPNPKPKNPKKLMEEYEND